jgi:hypothetical protein
MTADGRPAGVLPWHRRHPRALIAAILAGAVLVMSVMVVVVFMLVTGSIKTSEAYVGAMERVRADPAVTAAIGTPLAEGWLVTGNIHVSGPTGLAELEIPVSGPRGNATVYVDAAKRLGEWHFDHLIVQVAATRQRIDLAPPAAAAPPAR